MKKSARKQCAVTPQPCKHLGDSIQFLRAVVARPKIILADEQVVQEVEL